MAQCTQNEVLLLMMTLAPPSQCGAHLPWALLLCISTGCETSYEQNCRNISLPYRFLPHFVFDSLPSLSSLPYLPPTFFFLCVFLRLLACLSLCSCRYTDTSPSVRLLAFIAVVLCFFFFFARSCGVGMAAPNLRCLLGGDVTDKLLKKTGGLVGLAKLSDSALRHVGIDDFEEALKFEALSKHLHSGYILQAPIFHEYFVSNGELMDQVKTAQKALDLLGRRAAIVAKADLAAGKASQDITFGEQELEKVKAGFTKLKLERKVSAIDTQALAVPEVHKRGEAPKKKRGGLQAHKKMEARKEPQSVIEKITSRVKMGVSEEEQREELLQRADVRVQVMKEQEQNLRRETRKRKRNDDAEDEYGDLLNITL